MGPVSFLLIFSLQVVLLLYDLVINLTVDSLHRENVVELVLFIVQDISIVFQIIILFLEVFNTSTFQAGLVSDVFKQFRQTLLVLAIYLLLSISLHAWTMTLIWTEPYGFLFEIGGFYALFLVHRLCAIFYYYYYKRSAMRIVDPRFYKVQQLILNSKT